MESTKDYAVFCPGNPRAVMIRADNEEGALKKLADFLNVCPSGFKEAFDYLCDDSGNPSMKMITSSRLRRCENDGWFTPFLVKEGTKAYFEGVFLCNLIIDDKTVWLK